MRHQQIQIDAVHGDLVLPPKARGLVLFVHGSGSSRFSSRNRAVADTLHPRGLGTLLFDLLTESEAADRRKVFDIGLLAARVGQALAWVDRQAELAALPRGLFGASTGSAAALRAAAEHPDAVAAVVSRGGRPDLAAEWLPQVRAPTLLIVGGEDTEVLALNREAFTLIAGPKDLQVVPGATHLFEEPGTLAAVCRLAGTWFDTHLGQRPAR